MIIEDSGQIFTKGFLDYETTPSHSLTIRVTDGGGSSSTAVATITLENVDDNPPECSEPHLQKSIAENTTVGSKVNAHAEDIYFTKKHYKLTSVGEKKSLKFVYQIVFIQVMFYAFFSIGTIKNCEFVNNHNYQYYYNILYL